MADDDRSVGEQLAGWGKVALIETRGRLSGRAVSTAVGFWQAGDGSLYAAAGAETADWALNIRADGRCWLTIGDERMAYEAEEVEGDQRVRALRELILKYGTPAERLGRGPVFRLTRADSG